MRVLLAHNFYRSALPSGENTAVVDLARMLRCSGDYVEELFEFSDDIATLWPLRKAGVAIGPVYSPRALGKFQAMIDRQRPDVLHVHNVYPLISPWIVRAAHKHGIPVVSTVHNFRHECVAGTFFRDGEPCYDCSGSFLAIPAVRHGCYRGSRPQSAAMAVSRRFHRETWLTVDRFVALTEFHRAYIQRLGVPEGRIRVIGNSVPDPGRVSPAGRDVLFAGRLDTAKGVDLLIEAWARCHRSTGARLVIAGDGPLRELVKSASSTDPSIDYVGQLSHAQLAKHITSAGLLAFPSRWLEGQPLGLLEAMASGRPVVVANHGGLAASVDGTMSWAFDPGSSRSLAYTLDQALSSPRELELRGRAARQRYEHGHSPHKCIAALREVYAEVLIGGSR